MISTQTRRGAAALLTAVCLTALLLYFPGPSKEGVERGLTLSIRWLVPSLFPYMVLSSFLLRSGGGSLLNRLLRPVTRTIFRLPASAGAVICFSLIGGYPVGAKCVRIEYDRGELTAEDAQRLLCFCICSGPSFLVTAVGSAMLHNPTAGMVLYASQVISALFIGVCLGIGKRPAKTNVRHRSPKSSDPPVSLLTAIIEAVGDGTSSLLGVAGTVMLFQLIESLLSACGASEGAAWGLRALGVPFPANQVILPILLEVTGACDLLRENSLPLWWFSAATGFGGLCVWLQVTSIVGSLPVSKLRILLFRVLHGVVSALLTAVTAPIFLPPVETMALPGGGMEFEVSAATGAGSIALLIMSGIFVLCCKRKAAP